KTSGLRWLAVMAMVPVPWTRRRWALPFLTILAPSERYAAAHGRRHTKLTDWARQAILQVRRWAPSRKMALSRWPVLLVNGATRLWAAHSEINGLQSSRVALDTSRIRYSWPTGQCPVDRCEPARSRHRSWRLQIVAKGGLGSFEAATRNGRSVLIAVVPRWLGE